MRKIPGVPRPPPGIPKLKPKKITLDEKGRMLDEQGKVIQMEKHTELKINKREGATAPRLLDGILNQASAKPIEVE
jgi:hypothetical protein